MIERLKEIILDLLDAAAPELPPAGAWENPYEYIKTQKDLYMTIPLIVGYALALVANFTYLIAFCVWALLNVPVASYRIYKAKKAEA